MKKILTTVLALLSLYGVNAQNPDLIVDPSFNNGISSDDPIPGDPKQTFLSSLGRMKQLNDSMVVYFLNYTNYTTKDVQGMVLAKTFHSSGIITKTTIESYNTNYTIHSTFDYHYTDVAVNHSNGQIFLIKNNRVDDSGDSRKVISITAYNAYDGNQFSVNSNYGNSGALQIDIPNVDVSNGIASFIGNSLCLGHLYSTQVGFSITNSIGSSLGTSVVSNNPGVIRSSIADIYPISTTEVYIADNAHLYTQATNTYTDVSRVFKWNPSQNTLDPTYSGNGYGTSVKMPWNSDSETSIIQDKITRILYENGKIIVVGYTQIPDGNAWVKRAKVSRLNTNGTLDSAFAGIGTFSPDYSSSYNQYYFNDIDRASDGKYYLSAGANNIGNNYKSFLVSIDSGGNVNSSVGKNGILFDSNNYFQISETVIKLGNSALKDQFYVYGMTKQLESSALGRLVWNNSINNVGFEDLANSSKTSFYPNPARDFVTIDLVEEGSLRVLNLDGQTLVSQKLKIGENRIDLNELSKGFYLFEITSNAVHGNTVQTLKLIKQ